MTTDLVTLGSELGMSDGAFAALHYLQGPQKNPALFILTLGAILMDSYPKEVEALQAAYKMAYLAAWRANRKPGLD